MTFREVPAAKATTRDLVQSLRMTVCPSCQGVKRAYQTLCVDCYGLLPPSVQRALYRSVGNGYEAAVLAAATHLKKANLVLPERGCLNY